MADNLGTQADLHKQIATHIATQNVAIQEQIKLNAMNAAAVRGTTADIASAGEAAAKALQSVAKSSAQATQSTGGLGTSIGDADDAAKGLSEQAKDIGKNLVDAARAGGEAYDKALLALQKMIPTTLREELDNIQSTFGGLSGADGPFNATNEQAKKFVGVTHELYIELQSGSNKFAKAFGMLPKRIIGDLDEVMTEFGQLISGGDGLINSLKIAEVATADFVMEQQLLSKAMGLSVEQQKTFMTRQISLSGKAGNDMLKKSAVFAKNLATMTGDSMKMISKNIVGIIDDTEHFGNITEAQAARVSVSLRQMGLGYKELGSMVGKFTDFSGAVTSVSALTTVFGVQLDAMEMMQLANEDQEMFLRRMREQFLMSAKSVDEMTLAEKKLIGQQLGMADVGAVERFLDPDAVISSFEELAAGTGDAEEDISETMKYLKSDIVDLHQAIDVTTKELKNNLDERLRAPIAQTAIELEQSLIPKIKEMEQALPTAGMNALGSMAEKLTGLAGIKSGDLSGIIETLGSLGTSFVGAAKGVKDSDLAGVLKEVAGKLGPAGLDIGKVIADGITSAFGGITGAFKTVIDSLVETIKKSKLWHSSPGSEVGDKAAHYFLHPWTLLPPKMEKVMGETADKIVSATKDPLDKFNDEFKSAFDATRVKSEDLYKSLSKDAKKYYDERKEISNKDLDKQLSDSESFIAMQTKELGFKNVNLDKMGKGDKEYYKRLYHLGDDYEMQLKKIFASSEFSKGESMSKLTTSAAKELQDLQDSGRTIESFSQGYLDMIERDQGITKEMLEASLEANADTTKIAEGGVRARQKEIDAKGRADKTKAKDRDGKESSAATLRETSKLVANSIVMKGYLKEIRDSQKLIITAINSQTNLGTSMPDIHVKLDGNSIVDYVINNPAGSGSPYMLATTTNGPIS